MAYGYPGDAAQSFELFSRLVRQQVGPGRPIGGMFDAWEAGWTPSAYAAELNSVASSQFGNAFEGATQRGITQAQRALPAGSPGGALARTYIPPNEQLLYTRPIPGSATPLAEIGTGQRALGVGQRALPAGQRAVGAGQPSLATVATRQAMAQQAAAASNVPGAGTLMGRAGGGAAGAGGAFPMGPASSAGQAASNPFVTIANRQAGMGFPTVTGAGGAGAGSGSGMAGVAGQAGQVAQAAAPLAGRAAAMSNLSNSALPWLKVGAGDARLMQLGGMGGMMRAGGLATAGMLGGQAVDALNFGGEGSQLDSTLSSAARGAGLGAAAGSVVPVLGTAAGALAGAGAGALYGAFKKKSDPLAKFADEATRQTASLATIADAYGLDPASRAQLMQQFNADLKTAATLGGKAPNPAAISQIVQSYASQIPMMRQQSNSMSQAASRAVAMQQAIGQYMQPHIANANAQSTLSADSYQSLADKYASEPTGAYYGQMATNERNYGAKNSQAWAGAMQLIPTVNALSGYQQAQATAPLTFQSPLAGMLGGMPAAR